MYMWLDVYANLNTHFASSLVLDIGIVTGIVIYTVVLSSSGTW